MRFNRIIPGLGKPWTKRRVKWIIVDLLATLFGRRVEVEESDREFRVLPLIWRRRLYLLGMQHYRARLVFDSKYRTRIIETQPVIPYLKPINEVRNIEDNPRFLHAVLIHYVPEETNALIDSWKDWARSTGEIFVGYGGAVENFEKISHPHKCFVAQDEIWVNQRGGTHSYTAFILKAARYCIDNGFEGMLVTDADAWPTSPDYLSKICLPPWLSGYDFTALRLSDVTGSCFLFPECTTHTFPRMEDWLRRKIPGDPNTPVRILHHFAPLMYFSRMILEKMIETCSGEPPSHVEKSIGTYALHLGASYCAYEQFGVFDSVRWLRYRPSIKREELDEALVLGIPLVHPVKVNSWIEAYKHAHSS